ncbi:LysR family transcriptional regulator [Cysteiniphilum halobium]|uniref:LysR family transcriptional regulator n=1 Tax=Cysteiniphilum halobium TaxID=2219059 RepID=UPI0013C2D5F4|nr:LysR family transcriptional regulator [Cysteiniphilum halobium]
MSDILFPYRVFSLLADMNSFTKTAQQLNLATSSVTRIIQQLEDELGIDLVQRSTRHIKLTQAGDIFLDKVRCMVSEMDILQYQLQHQNDVLNGIVRISCPWYFSHKELAPLLDEFCQKNPDIRFEIECANELLNPERSDYDLYVRAGKPQDSNLRAKTLFDYSYLLVASPKYLAKRVKPIINIDDLKGDSIIVMHLGSSYHTWLFKKEAQEIRFNPSTHFKLASNSPEMVLSAALNHMGIALLPDIIALPHIADGSLCHILPDYQVTPNHFDNRMYLIYTKHSAALKKNKAVIDYLYHKFKVQK